MAADTGLESDYLSTLEMELDFQIHSMCNISHLLKKGKGILFCFRSDWRELSMYFFIPNCPEDAGLGEKKWSYPQDHRRRSCCGD